MAYTIDVLELQLDLDTQVHTATGGRRAALEHALRSAVRSGRLDVGTTLPSTRALASDLGLSRSTVVAAYEQLTAEGYLRSEHGRATRVARVPALAPAEPDVNVMGPIPTYDFRPGEPDASSFPRAAWLRSMRRVLSDAPDSAFGYADPRGVVELRAVLADYLGRTRSVLTSPSGVRIYGGFGSALGFVGETLRRRGVTKIAVESPAFPIHVDALRLTGLTTVPISIDRDGIVVDRLDALDVGAVLVTPAHQYPTSVTMSSQRRSELVEWARRTDAWIIEDDYDGEFRYDRRPIGALQGLDPERVVYAGTASKSIGAGMRLGWLVVPDGLQADLFRVTQARAGVSAIDQLALADFIAGGHLDRHVRQRRLSYQRRNDLLRAMLESEAPWLDVTPAAAGLHLAATIADANIDESRVLDAADRASVGLLGMRTHHGHSEALPGLAIGFSRPSEHGFGEALDRLADVVRSV